MTPAPIFKWDGAINVPTIITLVAVIVAGASGLATAQTRITELERQVDTLPREVAALRALVARQNEDITYIRQRVDDLK